MKSRQREFWIGIVCVIAVVAIWTAFHLVSRAGVRTVLTPFDLTALRFGVAALVLFPFAIRRVLGHLTLWQAMILAAFAGPGFALFAFPGFVLAPAAHAGAILSGTVALFTALFAWLFLRTRVGRLQLAGLVTLTAGIVFLIADGVTADIADQWVGDLMFLAAAANWAIYGLLVRAWQIDALRGTMITALLTAVVYLPVHFAWLPSNLASMPWPDLVLQAVFHGVVGMVASMMLFTRAVVALGPSLTSLSVASVPALAALGGWLILGEKLTVATITGVALVTAGIVGAVRGTPSREPRPPAGAAAQVSGPPLDGVVESTVIDNAEEK